jgi:hypothetical protein
VPRGRVESVALEDELVSLLKRMAEVGQESESRQGHRKPAVPEPCPREYQEEHSKDSQWNQDDPVPIQPGNGAQSLMKRPFLVEREEAEEDGEQQPSPAEEAIPPG